MRGDPVRVVIADDSVLLREGLARVLAEGGFDVVAQVGDAEGLLHAVAEHEAGRRDRRRAHAAHAHGRGRPGGEGEIRDELPDVGVLVLSQVRRGGARARRSSASARKASATC